MMKDTFTGLEQKKGKIRLLLLVGLLLVVGIGVLVWLVFARQTPPTASVSTNPHFSATSTPVSSKGTPPEVAGVVRQQVAQKLQLSIDQLTAKLQAAVPIESLAAQQGISADAWRTFVITTYQTAYAQAVSAGKVTQTRADHDMHSISAYPSDALNGWVTNDCLGVTA